MKQYLMAFATKEFYEKKCLLRDFSDDVSLPDSDTDRYVINRK
jgi:hypothetical protein